MKYIIAFIAIVSIYGCGSIEDRIIYAAKHAAGQSLKDPESAKFDNLFIVYKNPDENNLKSGYVCGFVNGKNSYGAYSGKSRFVAFFILNGESVDVHSVEIENSMDNKKISEVFHSNETIFERVDWNPNCVDATHPRMETGS